MVRSASYPTLVSGAPLEKRRELATNDVVLSKIRIGRVLGEGGMAVVHAAHHELLDLPVALKMLKPEHASDEAVHRFLHEAKIAAHVRSEHVCGILDVGLLDDGMPYILMDRLDGVTLDELLASRGRLRVGEAVDLVLQALEGLAHVHAAGVVHRDLKPKNLFVAVRQGRAPTLKIIDFGISKSDMLEGLTQMGSFMGSATYIAPEQIGDPHAVDERADLWAVGVVLYELVTGRLPFDGPALGVVLAKILREAPPAISSADVPRDLERVIARCLEKRPEDRWASAKDLAHALAPFASAPPNERLRRIAEAAPLAAARSVPSEPRVSGVRPLDATMRLDRVDPPPSSQPPPPSIIASLPKERTLAILLAVLVAVLCILVGVTVRVVRHESRSAPPSLTR